MYIWYTAGGVNIAAAYTALCHNLACDQDNYNNVLMSSLRSQSVRCFIKLRSCLYLCSCWNVSRYSLSTLLNSSAHFAKYAQYPRKCSCFFHFYQGCSGADRSELRVGKRLTSTSWPGHPSMRMRKFLGAINSLKPCNYFKMLSSTLEFAPLTLIALTIWRIESQLLSSCLSEPFSCPSYSFRKISLLEAINCPTK